MPSLLVAPSSARARGRPRRASASPGRSSFGIALAGMAAVALVGAAGCGASVSAIYEGDVRFEHCMALDVRPAATPSERRMCWIEWVRYYTYGQTQDRVEYARARASGTEGLAPAAPLAPAPLAAPGPTSAFAPPPMLAGPTPTGSAPPPGAAASAPSSGPAASAPAPDAPAPPSVPSAAASAPPGPTGAPPPRNVEPGCHADCVEAREDCRNACRGASCEKSCSGKFTRCLERCAESRGGGRR